VENKYGVTHTDRNTLISILKMDDPSIQTIHMESHRNSRHKVQW